MKLSDAYFLHGTLLIALMAWAFGAEAQSVSKVFSNAARTSTAVYEDSDAERQQLLLPMGYGNASFQEELEGLISFSDQEIDSVHLVYTDFPKGMNLDGLNTHRMQSLKALLPELLDQYKSIDWKIVAQQGFEDKQGAMQLFHGFAIYTHPKEVKASAKPVSETKELTVDEKEKLKIATRKRFDRLTERKLGIVLDNDSSTSSVFNRNKDWENVVIISDWTGSMYKYTLQVLLWQVNEQATQNIQGYVFFNDGGFKENNSKVVGETGGLYLSKNPTVFPVVSLMSKVKESGDGGDIPENDIEAILFAQGEFPEAEEFVIIADNRSEMRDFELLSSIKKPVRVVLARVSEKEDGTPIIHSEYLKLALATNGSVHTQKVDINSKEELEKLLKDKVTAPTSDAN
ncbi:hypothetical protein V6R21_12360 [Limibacter armeniacum]|uniref:hypothetical protein n=1 Tax=Limibacter armeniacum TaxID=466084 RepID=UPI002FE68A84